MKKLAWITIVLALVSVVLIGVLINENNGLEAEQRRQVIQWEEDMNAAIEVLHGQLEQAEENARTDAVLYEAALFDAHAKIEQLEQDMQQMIRISDAEAAAESAAVQAASPLLAEIEALNAQIASMHSQSALDAAVTAAIEDTAKPLNAEIDALERRIDALFTQDDLNSAVNAAKEEAAAPLLVQIQELNAQIASMHSQSALAAAVAAAIEDTAKPLNAEIDALERRIDALFTQDDLNSAVEDASAPLQQEIAVLRAQLEKMHSNEDLASAVEEARNEAKKPLLEELEDWAQKADQMVQDALAQAREEAERIHEEFIESDLGKNLAQARADLSSSLARITSHEHIVSSLLPITTWMIDQNLLEDVNILITISQGEVTQTLTYTNDTLSSLNLELLNDTAYTMTITVTDGAGNELISHSFVHQPEFD